MTPYLSEKVKIVSFFSIVLVVFLHAYNLENTVGAHPLYFGSAVWAVQDFVSYGVTRIAVPLFFVFSGFLFFQNRDGKIDFATKISKRVRTLLVPFLIWSLLGIALYFILQSLPQTAVFFTKERVADFSPTKWLQTIFIHPVPYQFWFIRDLMLLVLLSPLLYFLLRHLGVAWLLLVLVPWMVVTNAWQNSIEALLFFSAGGYLALSATRWLDKRYDAQAPWILSGWLLLVGLKTAMIAFGSESLLPQIVFKLSILAGTIAVWGMYDRLFKKVPRLLLEMCSFTFFIYAAHEPLLTILKKLLLMVLGKEPSGFMATYWIAPVLAIGLALVAGLLLRKFASAIYATLTGGR